MANALPKVDSGPNNQFVEIDRSHSNWGGNFASVMECHPCCQK